MKRIILVSLFVITSFVVFSCADDTLETSSNNITEKLVANASGDPISPTTPPRPKK